MEINTNVSSSILQKTLNLNNTEITKTVAKLASGTSASSIEDAANVILSEQQDIKRQDSQQAIDNTQAGISMLQTADSGMSSITDNMSKIRDLSLQGMNGTNNQDDLNAIKAQISDLKSQIDNTAKTTSFNKINLLDGSNKDLSIQTGINSSSNDNSTNIGSALNNSTSEALGLPTDDELNKMFDKSSDSSDIFKKIDSAMSTVSDARSNIGAIQQTFDTHIDNLAKTAYSSPNVSDTDYAKESMNYIQAKIKQSATTSLMYQTNHQPEIALSLFGG
ncbi:MAG: flagellin [bacterium]